MKTLLRTLLCGALVHAAVLSAAPRDAARALHAEFPSKPTGPIAVEHRRSGAVAVGVPLTVTITARVAGAVAALGIEASATSPQALVVAEPRVAAADDGIYVWEIAVVPLVADAGYLSVIVAGTIDGVDQARSVTIPLRSVGAVDAGSAPPADGEPLISLPVEESP